MSAEHLTGQVVDAQSGFFGVKTDQGYLTCQLRGRLKQGPRLGDLAAIGDWVEVTDQGGGAGMIEAVAERSRMLVRLDPTPRGVYRQIIIANPDQAVFVFACAQPAPRLGMLDRFLVVAEKQDIPAFIVANKLDLVGQAGAEAQFGHYAAVGYSVVYTSARDGAGVEELKERLSGRLSVLAGPSGVGKSSLMNAIQPGLGLAVREVSLSTTKGKHTTVSRRLFPLLAGGYIADTPGLKALALWDIRPEELDGYFPDLRDLVPDCDFSDCTHLHEPGCAVLAALASGKLHPLRYQSYVRMRTGNDET